MEHWSPEDAGKAEQSPPPRDVWVQWLMRAPSHEVMPDRPRVSDWVGGVMLGGVVLFWATTAALVWRAFS